MKLNDSDDSFESQENDENLLELADKFREIFKKDRTSAID